ncbi:MAG: uroporphyrinogen decarboxylase family protein [Bacteroidetes bacterium]|nr:uroporphyrinogen decarboxylase family protein [Bacteroidota bacterium]
MRNNTEWIAKLLSSRRRYAIPIMTHPGIDLIGKTVKEAVTDGEIHYQAIDALYKKYPSDAATIIMDLTVEAEAFGSEIKMPNDEVPTVLERIVYDADSVNALTVPDLNAGRIQEYLKAAHLAAQHIHDKPVFAGCIGPISLAGRLFDMSELMMSLYTEPDVIQNLLQKCTAFIIKYVGAFKDVGVNGIVIAEPAAGLLSEEMCDAYSSKYVRQIIEQVQDENFLVILHNCGNKGHLTQSMISTGAKGLHFGNAINMVEALAEIPSDIIAMGNLDPVNVFKMKTPVEVYFSTIELLEKTRTYTNFVISSGCDTPPNVQPGNIDAFYQAVTDFNQS